MKDDDEEVGDVFQDDNSEAAILVNHDVNDDAIILVSTSALHFRSISISKKLKKKLKKNN